MNQERTKGQVLELIDGAQKDVFKSFLAGKQKGTKVIRRNGERLLLVAEDMTLPRAVNPAIFEQDGLRLIPRGQTLLGIKYRVIAVVCQAQLEQMFADLTDQQLNRFFRTFAKE